MSRLGMKRLQFYLESQMLMICHHYLYCFVLLRQILMNTQVLLFIIALEESRDYQPATGKEVSLCKILEIGYY